MRRRLYAHAGKSPTIHPTAYVAPTATLCGDVRIGAHCRIMHGATLVAHTGTIEIGEYGIVMENAVIRATPRSDCAIGKHCFVGAHAQVAGARIGDEVFVATASAVLYGADVGERSEIRYNGLVHARTRVPPDTTVPVGWIAVGDPGTVLPPQEHERIWSIQRKLDFPLVAFGIDRANANMPTITRALAEELGAHIDDEPAKH